MTLKAFAALIMAAAIGCAPLSALAHEGHPHPPAKSKKVKKTKAQQKTGIDIPIAVQPVRRGADSSGIGPTS